MNELNTFKMLINIDEAFTIYNIFEFFYCFVVIIIYCDNQKAQTLAKNFINYFRIKHINIQHHFVREKIIKNQIQLKHVSTHDQIINNFTKSLFRNVFEKFRNAFDLI